jgi:hypothetical protein
VISSPFDVEGHLGVDGRYYLLDFSRVMPPEMKNRCVSVLKINESFSHFVLLRLFPGGILFQLLRPEFVMKYVKKFKKVS